MRRRTIRYTFPCGHTFVFVAYSTAAMFYPMGPRTSLPIVYVVFEFISIGVEIRRDGEAFAPVKGFMITLRLCVVR